MNWTILPAPARVHVFNLTLRRPLPCGPFKAPLVASTRHLSHRIDLSHCSTSSIILPLHRLNASPSTSRRLSSQSLALLYRNFSTRPFISARHLLLQQQISKSATQSILCHRLHHTPIRYYSKSARDNNEDVIRKGAQENTPRSTSEASSHPNAGLPQPDLQTPKHLSQRLPNLGHRFHRPTKEELLAAATGFWSRLRVRFKWFSIRDLRPFNLDEVGAFFSWIVVGHLIWIIVGTTTFFSLLILTVNTVFAQETLARWIGNYLTQSSGIKVVFESAIVPKWKDGVITFKNVFVSRRPGQKRGTVTKGSQTHAQVAAAAASQLANERLTIEDEDTNYTQFDVTIETVNVTLSFTKWFNGKGLLKDVEVKGVRGAIDRTHLKFPTEYIDPRTYKHRHNPGDFEIESFKLQDLLVSVYQPRNFRPFSVSIYTADLPQLRKQWLFYDFMSANHVSGSFDDSLFTIHPRQTHNVTGEQLTHDLSEADHTPWKKQSRIRIDGLKIDHLNRGVQGPFSWIHEGNVDIVADILLPADHEDSIGKVMADFYERMEAEVISRPSVTLEPPSPAAAVINNSGISQLPEGPEPIKMLLKQDEHDNRFLILDLRVHLNAVHASVPLFTRDLSYVNNALIRPIVAYINNKRQFIPVNCRVVKRASEFDGSWTMYDSGLMEDLNREIYEAFAADVVDDQARMRRIKKVGLWSLQLAFQALFLGLAGNIA